MIRVWLISIYIDMEALNISVVNGLHKYGCYSRFQQGLNYTRYYILVSSHDWVLIWTFFYSQKCNVKSQYSWLQNSWYKLQILYWLQYPPNGCVYGGRLAREHVWRAAYVHEWVELHQTPPLYAGRIAPAFVAWLIGVTVSTLCQLPLLHSITLAYP